MASSSVLFLQRAGVLGPAWALAAWGMAGMGGMRHHAGLRLHPEAPSSLLGYQQRRRTAKGGQAGQSHLLQPFRAVRPLNPTRPRQAAEGPRRAAP